jgi:hypothetical protein
MNKYYILLSIIAVANTINAVILPPKPSKTEMVKAMFTATVSKIMPEQKSAPKVFDTKFKTKINGNTFDALFCPPLFARKNIFKAQQTLHIKEVTPQGTIVDHGTIYNVWQRQFAQEQKEEEKRRQSRKDPKFMSSEERAAEINRQKEHYYLNERLDTFIENNNATHCPNKNTIFLGVRDCKYCYTDSEWTQLQARKALEEIIIKST